MAPQRELTIDDYIGILRRRWPIILALTLFGAGIGIGLTKLLPKRYTSKTLVLVEQPNLAPIALPGSVSSDTSERFASMQQQILSSSRLEPVIKRLNLYVEDVNKTPMEDLVERLRKAIDVTPIQPMAQTRAQGLPGFTIGVTFSNALMAQQICSTVTSMFMEENLKLQQIKAEHTADFLDTQLVDAKARLDEQDARLAAFQRSHLGALPDDRTTNLNVLTGLAAQLDATTQAVSRTQQDKTFAESSLAQQLAAWQASLEGRAPETYQQQVTALEAQLAALKSKYTDDHPDVVKLKRDIAAARKMAEASEQTTPVETTAKPALEPAQIQSLRAQIRQYNQVIQDRIEQQEEIRRRIASYQARIESTPAVEQEYKSLTRDYQTAVESYNDLLKRRDSAEMAKVLQAQQQGEQFRVLDPASQPDKPSFPDPIKFVLGGLVGGLTLGLGLTLLLEMRDTSVRTDKDVEALLHLPVLAVVSTLSKPAKTSNNAKAKLSLEPVAR
jgi:polysaccharide chain length determinant protein (PEP-CTERM system associated)